MVQLAASAVASLKDANSRLLREDIAQGRVEFRALPEVVTLNHTDLCNLRCIMCPRNLAQGTHRLSRRVLGYLAEELEIYFDDISDAAERIWDTLENYKEVVEALESTNEAVLSHRLNDSFRILTAASVILLPLTLIASIFGMNVQFPGEGETITFFLFLALMAAVLVGLVILFRRRGWL